MQVALERILKANNRPRFQDADRPVPRPNLNRIPYTHCFASSDLKI